MKCYSSMDEVSIYNQMFVCNGQMQKMNSMFILVLIFIQYFA